MANLLTQEDKKVLMRRDKMTIVLVYILGAIFIMAVGLVFLIPSYFLSEYKLDGVENRLELLQASVSAKKNEETNRSLNEARSLVAVLEGGLAEASMGEVVTDLVSSSPSDIYLNDFLVAKDSDGQLEASIEGVAATRSGLLEFVDILKDSPRFEEVNLPIGVLARERNIDFSLSFKVLADGDI